jgi:hypothetical protein
MRLFGGNLDGSEVAGSTLGGFYRSICESEGLALLKHLHLTYSLNEHRQWCQTKTQEQTKSQDLRQSATITIHSQSLSEAALWSKQHLVDICQVHLVDSSSRIS